MAQSNVEVNCFTGYKLWCYMKWQRVTVEHDVVCMRIILCVVTVSSSPDLIRKVSAAPMMDKSRKLTHSLKENQIEAGISCEPMCMWATTYVGVCSPVCMLHYITWQVQSPVGWQCCILHLAEHIPQIRGVTNPFLAARTFQRVSVPVNNTSPGFHTSELMCIWHTDEM